MPCTGPGCGLDTLFSAWTLAWQSHALTTAPSRFADANIYHPAPDALYFGPAGFGALPYFIASFLVSGSAALASNVALLLGATLSALSMHWVVRRWTGSDAAGVVAAATVLLQPWYLFGFVGATPHLAPIMYLPLIVWLAANLGRTTGRAVLLASLIAIQSLTDPVYIAPAVAAPLATLALWRFARRSRADGVRLAMVLAAALVCVLPFVFGYVRVRGAQPDLELQTLWRNVLRPAELTSLFWREANPSTFAPAALAVIAAGAVAALRRRRSRPDAIAADQGWRHGALWLVVGAAISLTPTATFLGREIYLPGHVLSVLTGLYEVLRAPNRLGVAAMIGGAILTGVGFAEIAALLARIGRWGRFLPGAAAASAVLLLYLVPAPGTKSVAGPYPVQAVPTVPASFVEVLAEDQRSVLRLPVLVGPLPHPSWNARAMYQSTFHWRPLVNGYSSYWPDGYLERLDLTRQLPARSALVKLVRATGLGAIWVDLGDCTAAERLRWTDARLGRVRGLEFRAAEGDELLFTIDPRLK